MLRRLAFRSNPMFEVKVSLRGRVQNSTKKRHFAKMVNASHLIDEIDSIHIPTFLNDQPTRLLRIGLCGAPNAGKSSLINAFVGKKVSAVSHKVNTTRISIMGIRTIRETQLLFYDTPGILQKSGSSQEEKALTAVAKDVLNHMDAYLTLIDGSIPMTYLSREVVHTALSLSQTTNAHLLLAVNKADRIAKSTVEKRKKEIAAVIPSVFYSDIGIGAKGEGILSLSAMTGYGYKDLETRLLLYAKPGKWLFSDSVATNLSQEEQISELIRECIFQYLNQEIPYQTGVIHKEWKREGDKLINYQFVYTTTSTQRKIMLGYKSRIESKASLEASKVFHRRIAVHLIVLLYKEKSV